MVQSGREAEGSGVLILGDSRAKADIIPGMLGKDYVNLGVGGATPIEMYYTLSEYIEKNGSPREVYIMFAPFHYSYMDNYRTRTMYFKHLTFSQAMEVYSKGRSYGAKVFDDLDRFDIISMYAGLPDSYLPALINARIAGRYDKNRALYEKLKEERGHALYGLDNGNDDINYEANYEHMNMEGEHLLITFYFDRLLKLCSSNGIKTTLLQPPMNRASFDALHDDYVREYRSYIRGMARDNPGIVFEDEIPCYDNSYFGDSSHLNEKGAVVYTREIMDKYVKQSK